MPTKLQDFDFKRQKKNREPQFLQYFDGDTWSISLKETEYASIDSLRSAIYGEAYEAKLKIRTTKVDDDTLVFQTLGPAPEKPEKTEDSSESPAQTEDSSEEE